MHTPETAVEGHDPQLSSRIVFGAAIFLGAFLLFQIEFILAKFLLPWFGGTTGVWATSMLCFQVALLAGYAYVHWVERRADAARIHLALLAVTTLFLAARILTAGVLPGAAAKPAPDANPVLGIIWIFFTVIGLPFAVLASTAPLLQAWYARIHKREPYLLYSLSNAGSLLALLSYPLVFERLFRMRLQAGFWAAGLFVYVVFTASCAWRAMREHDLDPVSSAAAKITASTRWMWLGLSACASALFLAVTNYLTQDIAPIPLLWALPLAIYLLSFILVFGDARIYVRGLWHTAFVVTSFLAIAALYVGTDLAVGKQLVIFSAWLFVCCMICHGELVALRPEESGLTSFYLTIAGGGALGGIFVALAAPMIFSAYWELHVAVITTALVASFALWLRADSWLYRAQPWLVPAVLAGLLLAPGVLRRFDFEMPAWTLYKAWPLLAIVLLLAAAWMFFTQLGNPQRWRIPFLNEAVVGLVLLSVAVALTWETRLQYGEVVFRKRNFYGALTVDEQELNSNTRYFELVHGRISHGNQLTTKASARYEPTTYYHEGTGVGLILRNHPKHLFGNIRVGAIGLGAGTVSAYARVGDVFRFYEINPQVIELAQSRPNPWFDYVPHARSIGARVDIVPGDARLSLERELRDGHPGGYDVIIVDAFNGDSIPVHLLTVEAIQLYLKHLHDQDSVIALHISNRAVDLRTVAAGLADKLELYATWIQTDESDALNLKSDWVLLSRSSAMLKIPPIRAAGLGLLMRRDLLLPPPPKPVWTDDYSNVWQVLDLKGD